MTNALMHYGVLGMKWGVRRYQNADGTLTAAGRKRARAQANKETKATNKRVSTERKQIMKDRRGLTDQDLQKAIDRLKMEQTLKDMTKADISPGQTFVKNTLKAAGKKTATSVATGATIYAVKAALTKKFDIMEFASYAAPKPKK